MGRGAGLVRGRIAGGPSAGGPSAGGPSAGGPSAGGLKRPDLEAEEDEVVRLEVAVDDVVRVEVLYDPREAVDDELALVALQRTLLEVARERLLAVLEDDAVLDSGGGRGKA